MQHFPLKLVTILNYIDTFEYFHEVGIVPAYIFMFEDDTKNIFRQLKQLLTPWLYQRIRQ